MRRVFDDTIVGSCSRATLLDFALRLAAPSRQETPEQKLSRVSMMLAAAAGILGHNDPEVSDALMGVLRPMPPQAVPLPVREVDIDAIHRKAAP